MVIALEQPRRFGIVEFTEQSLWDGLLGNLFGRQDHTPPAPTPIKVLAPTAAPKAQPSPTAATGKISDHYAMLKSLDPKDATRSRIEGKLRDMMEKNAKEKNARISEAATFAALWRAMERGSNGNLLERDISRAVTLTKLQPIAKSAKIEVPQIANNRSATVGKTKWVRHAAHDKSRKDPPNHRANLVRLSQRFETASAQQLAFEYEQAEKLKNQTGAISDPKLARETDEMAESVKLRIAEETQSRLYMGGIMPTKSGDIEQDLAAAQALEDKRTAELNRVAMALTPIGLMRGMAMAMAGKGRA